jgi:hypothetical protein
MNRGKRLRVSIRTPMTAATAMPQAVRTRSIQWTCLPNVQSTLVSDSIGWRVALRRLVCSRLIIPSYQPTQPSSITHFTSRTQGLVAVCSVEKVHSVMSGSIAGVANLGSQNDRTPPCEPSSLRVCERSGDVISPSCESHFNTEIKRRASLMPAETFTPTSDRAPSSSSYSTNRCR